MEHWKKSLYNAQFRKKVLITPNILFYEQIGWNCNDLLYLVISRYLEKEKHFITYKICCFVKRRPGNLPLMFLKKTTFRFARHFFAFTESILWIKIIIIVAQGHWLGLVFVYCPEWPRSHQIPRTISGLTKCSSIYRQEELRSLTGFFVFELRSLTVFFVFKILCHQR